MQQVAGKHKLHEIEILQLNILQILGKSGTKFQVIQLDRKAQRPLLSKKKVVKTCEICLHSLRIGINDFMVDLCLL